MNFPFITRTNPFFYDDISLFGCIASPFYIESKGCNYKRNNGDDVKSNARPILWQTIQILYQSEDLQKDSDGHEDRGESKGTCMLHFLSSLLRLIYGHTGFNSFVRLGSYDQASELQRLPRERTTHLVRIALLKQ
jgi:hypothetical protein